MKKGAILIALIFLISAVSAASCPDGSKVVSDQNEIDKGSTRSINSIIIGLVRTEDLNVIKKTIAHLMIDARRIELSKSSPLQEIELDGDYYDVEIQNATEEEAKIKVDGNSETIAEGESETVDGKIFALIASGESTNPDAPHVRILAGMEEISISNDAPSKKITFKNKSHIIELVSISAANAVIKVSNCKTGDITDAVSEAEIPANTTQTNASVNTPVNVTNAVSNTNVTKTEQNNTQAQPEEEPGFFRRILNWLKSIFSITNNLI